MMEGYMVNLRMVVEKFMFRKTHNISNNMQKNFALALRFIGEFYLLKDQFY